MLAGIHQEAVHDQKYGERNLEYTDHRVPEQDIHFLRALTVAREASDLTYDAPDIRGSLCIGCDLYLRLPHTFLVALEEGPSGVGAIIYR